MRLQLRQSLGILSNNTKNNFSSIYCLIGCTSILLSRWLQLQSLVSLVAAPIYCLAGCSVAKTHADCPTIHRRSTEETSLQSIVFLVVAPIYCLVGCNAAKPQEDCPTIHKQILESNPWLMQILLLFSPRSRWGYSIIQFNIPDSKLHNLLLL